MKFLLRYRGQLPGRGSVKPADKNAVRFFLSRQLKQIWRESFEPFYPLEKLKSAEVHKRSVWNNRQEKTKLTARQFYVRYAEHEDWRDIRYIPLITANNGLKCDLSIRFGTWRKHLGKVLDAGDLDGRLRIVFDALCLPPSIVREKHERDLSKVEGNHMTNDCFCLLQDDCFIDSVSIEPFEILDEPKLAEEKINQKESVLHIMVSLRRDDPLVRAEGS